MSKTSKRTGLSWLLYATLFLGCAAGDLGRLNPDAPGTITFSTAAGDRVTVYNLTGNWVFVDTGLGLDGAVVQIKQRQNRIRGTWLKMDWAAIDIYWEDRPPTACSAGDLFIMGKIEKETIVGKRFLCHPRFLSDPLICGIADNGNALEVQIADWEGKRHSTARLIRIQ